MATKYKRDSKVCTGRQLSELGTVQYIHGRTQFENLAQVNGNPIFPLSIHGFGIVLEKDVEEKVQR